MSSERIEPLGDRILIRPLKGATMTAGGLHIPEAAQEKPQKGEIVALSQNSAQLPRFLDVGDVVIYGRYSGIEVEHEGEPLLMVRLPEILALVHAK